MHPTRHRHLLAMPVVVLLSFAVVACAGGSGSGAGDQVSLPPARVTTAPAPAESVGALPSVGAPEGTAPPPPEVTIEYTSVADDLPGFIASYRETFGGDLSDERIGAAGARLCTYLQRHADADGGVPIGTAISEADANEPGYPRDVWVAAFDLVTSSYCGEFNVVGGDMVTP